MATGEEQSVLMSMTGHYKRIASNPQENIVAEVTRTESQTLSFSNIHKIGTCNVRSMNQGKLDVVKTEMKITRT